MKEKTLLRFLFGLLKEEKLEKKVWFRLLKVLHIGFYMLMILIVLLVGSIAYFDRTIISAEVLCKDGTKWNAMRSGYLLSSNDLCGLCAERTTNGEYTPCYYWNIDYNSYKIINKEFKHNVPIYAVIGLPFVLLIIGLALLKAIIIGIVYIISGIRAI